MRKSEDILRRMMSSLPPDQEGHTKAASSKPIDDLVKEALASLEKTSQEEETPPAPKDTPPEFIAQQEKKEEPSEAPVEEKAEEKADEKEEKAEEEMPLKEAYVRIGKALLKEQQKPPERVKTAEEVELEKRAAEQQIANDDFMQKVAAEAMADELAKIAYAEMSGIDFEEYLEKKSAGWLSSMGRGVSHLGKAVGGTARGTGRNDLRALLNIGKGRGILEGAMDPIKAQKMIQEARMGAGAIGLGGLGLLGTGAAIGG